MTKHNCDNTVAVSLAQNGRKDVPNLPLSADTLGWAYHHNCESAAAAPTLENAVKAVTNHQTYRNHLCLTHQKLQNPSRAKGELQEAISIDPQSRVAEQARRAIGQKPLS